MSKKNIKKEIIVAENENAVILNSKSTLTAGTLQELMETHQNVSIRMLAKTLDVSYNAMLKASKAPIPGTVYDPDAVNYEAVLQVLEKHEKVEDVMELDWDSMNENAHSSKATLVKDIEKFNIGDLVYLRENNVTPFEIIYKTETNIVIMLQGTSEPRVLKNSTFLFKGPSFEQRTVVETVED